MKGWQQNWRSCKPNLDFLSSDERRSYEFSGAEGVPLEQAMHLMDELQKVDQLQEQLEQCGAPGVLAGC